MKDLYTFDIDVAAALASYRAARQAYNAIFEDLKIPYVVAAADSGSIGGELSHEYHVLCSSGEDTVFCCGRCDFAINQELAAGANVQEMLCPKCSMPSLQAKRAIELAHTFHLGSRYSKPLGLEVTVKPPDQSGEEFTRAGTVPLQMGCHGLGISRLIAAAADIYKDGKGLNWPRLMAPFEVVVVSRNEHKADLVEVFHALSTESAVGPNISVVLDDRSKSFVWKLNDADLIGYPIIVILGRGWTRARICEVQCRRLGIKEEVRVECLRQRVHELLRNV